MKVIENGITAPKGFLAAGLAAGIKKGNKKETTQWLIDLHIISNKIEHSSTITLEKFEFVKSVYIWLKNLLKETNKVYS